MHKKFDSGAIEKKWQDKWQDSDIYTVGERDTSKEKEYVLVEWPYPSGNLHIGHWYAFAVPDIYVRYRRMTGKQVIYPMGFDAFGLPAENAAIKRNLDPKAWTNDNIAHMKTQLASMGNAFSWDKTTNSTDPEYYKWTQWMFTEFFKHDIAYRGKGIVNWCPGCNTVIANEQVHADGTCDRSGDIIEKREMPQWMLRITKYADRLVDDLDTLAWPEHIKEAQRQWIGRSKGAEVNFNIKIGQKRKVLILHGFEGSPDYGWKPWLKSELEKQGYEVIAPQIPNFDHPNYEETMNFLKPIIEELTESDCIVGHSLGCHFALKISEQVKLNKVVLVAPCVGGFPMPYESWKSVDPSGDYDACEIVLEKNIVDFGKIKVNNKIAIYGENDRGIPISHANLLDSSWKVIRKAGTGHMSNETEVQEILESVLDTVTVFTTRPDTIYGATYLVLAPEHPLVIGNKTKISNWSEVETYISESKQKAEQDRLDNTKEKTGVKLEGITAKNPASGEEIPVYIADYVLASYGTGAIMAVPAHDERDFAFANKFGIKTRQVVSEFVTYDGPSTPRSDVDTLVRDCVDMIIEHPTDGTFLLQKESDGANEFVHFVGGGTDGEEDRLAISRELREETGFTDFVVNESPITTVRALGYRHSKGKNQLTKNTFYYVKLNSLEQIPSEIEEGKHTIKWVAKDEVAKQINWIGHARAWEAFLNNTPFAGAGTLINSGEFDGMDSEKAKEAILKKVGGKMTSTYRLRDWSIGRQRYWGVPIPIVYDPEGKAHLVPKEHLPWLLPEDVDFKPTGEAPLAKSEALKKRTEEIFGAGWTPEVETMDTFVDSSWYFLRYLDNHNGEVLADLNRQKDWMPIDIYFGGAEHTTMHLLYSRFWQKALFDLGLVTEGEPYKRRINRGLILGPDGNKMSKSKGNVIDPDEQVKTVGADTVKMYLAFMGPYEGANYPFDLGGIAGIRRFLERVYGLSEHLTEIDTEETERVLHKTIAKVRGDIEVFKFNTAISAMMIFVNQAEKTGLTKDSYLTFISLLAPFAPHLTEEIYSEQGNDKSIHTASYPSPKADLLEETVMNLGVQVNGKLRGTILVRKGLNEDEVVKLALENSVIAKYVTAKNISKVVYVPGRILSLITT